MREAHEIRSLAFKICSLAIDAILYEATCFPSPGLVSKVSMGAHKDMDYYTFIDSTSALIKPLLLCANAGFTSGNPSVIFKEIRKIGIQGEKEMFQSTNGVNTHKGMLFLMGICCAAAAKALYEKKDFDCLQGIIKEMTAGIVQRELYNMKKVENLSHGEMLYLKYKTTGIRGEVESGLPLIFDFSIEFYNDCAVLSKNDRLVHTLIGIMQFCEDSNILNRHSIDVLRKVQERAKEIIKIGGMKTIEGRNAVESLDKEFLEKNISPGGSADLLGITVFLSKLKASQIL